MNMVGKREKEEYEDTMKVARGERFPTVHVLLLIRVIKTFTSSPPIRARRP